jgi:hypothetical protein
MANAMKSCLFFSFFFFHFRGEFISNFELQGLCESFYQMHYKKLFHFGISETADFREKEQNNSTALYNNG